MYQALPVQRARAPLHRPGAAGKRAPGAPGAQWRMSLPKLQMPRLPMPLGRPHEQQQQQPDSYVVQEGFRPEPVPLEGGGKAAGAQQQASSLQQRVAGAFLAAAVAPAQPPAQQQAQQPAAQPPPPQAQQQQQPPQQQQLAPALAQPRGALAPPAGAPPPSAYDAASQQLAFARHLSTASNGLAPLSSRLESLSYLVFTTGQAQARLLRGPASDPRSWLESGEGVALLERVYLLGQAVADLGAAADGAYAAGAGGVAASNGQRALASLDFASLLSRYLAQVCVLRGGGGDGGAGGGDGGAGFANLGVGRAAAWRGRRCPRT